MASYALLVCASCPHSFGSVQLFPFFQSNDASGSELEHVGYIYLSKVIKFAQTKTVRFGGTDSKLLTEACRIYWMSICFFCRVLESKMTPVACEITSKQTDIQKLSQPARCLSQAQSSWAAPLSIISISIKVLLLSDATDSGPLVAPLWRWVNQAGS